MLQQKCGFIENKWKEVEVWQELSAPEPAKVNSVFLKKKKGVEAPNLHPNTCQLGNLTGLEEANFRTMYSRTDRSSSLCLFSRRVFQFNFRSGWKCKQTAIFGKFQKDRLSFFKYRCRAYFNVDICLFVVL